MGFLYDALYFISIFCCKIPNHSELFPISILEKTSFSNLVRGVLLSSTILISEFQKRRIVDDSVPLQLVLLLGWEFILLFLSLKGINSFVIFSSILSCCILFHDPVIIYPVWEGFFIVIFALLILLMFSSYVIIGWVIHNPRSFCLRCFTLLNLNIGQHISMV